MSAQKKSAPRRGGGWLRAQLRRRPLPVWVLVTADVLVFAVALNVFALFHHVLPRHEQAVGVRSQRGGTQTAATATEVPILPEQAADALAAGEEAQATESEAQVEPAATEPEGYFGAKFADKFTGGEVEQTSELYRSANINLTVTPYNHENVRFYVMEFYLRDISSFQTGFANDEFGRGRYELVSNTLARMGAIAGVNGDYYGGRSDGIVLRNGTLYRSGEKLKRDICVLYWDGTMETCSPEAFDVDAAVARGAYQIWNFGPMLLDAHGHRLLRAGALLLRSGGRAFGRFEGADAPKSVEADAEFGLRARLQSGRRKDLGDDIQRRDRERARGRRPHEHGRDRHRGAVRGGGRKC